MKCTYCTLEFVQQYWIQNDDDTVVRLVYELGANYEERIAERVHNEARSVLNRLDLNDVYDKKDDIGHDIEVELKKWLTTFGIRLEKTLTNDVNDCAARAFEPVCQRRQFFIVFLLVCLSHCTELGAHLWNKFFDKCAPSSVNYPQCIRCPSLATNSAVHTQPSGVYGSGSGSLRGSL